MVGWIYFALTTTVVILWLSLLTLNSPLYCRRDLAHKRKRKGVFFPFNTLEKDPTTLSSRRIVEFLSPANRVSPQPHPVQPDTLIRPPSNPSISLDPYQYLLPTYLPTIKNSTTHNPICIYRHLTHTTDIIKRLFNY